MKEIYKDYVKSIDYRPNLLGYIVSIDSEIWIRVRVVFDLESDKSYDLACIFKYNEVELATEAESHLINKMLVFS